VENPLKPYDLLVRGAVDTIHEQAMTILDEIGVDFLHDRAKEHFAKGRHEVEENRVRLKRAFVLEAGCQDARPPFERQARNPKRS